MILSMTGYGNAVADYQGKKIHVEIKALNSKALDLNVRIATLYREKEMEIRQIVSEKLLRGKVDVTIWVEKSLQDLAQPINQQVVNSYYQQIRQMSEQMGIDSTDIKATDWMTVLLRLPDVMAASEVEVLSDEEWGILRENVLKALDELVAFRKQEGKALQAKFTEKVDNIEQLLLSIEPFEKSRVEKIRQRIIESLEKLALADYDHNRLEQEMIYYIEKLDINEEKQRLKNHLDYFRQTMEAEPGQGKKLGFIAQEMGREINTTGSKSNQAEMQNIVVKMKDELEQIKEQVLNVL
ncbi:MAG: YicC family protein [Bacteroidaceae bacterium]|nr:YicC family protein [Bacteroidaceae bacterium]